MSVAHVPIQKTFAHRGAVQFFARAFPTPQFLQPPSIGIDISDTSIKWLALSHRPHGSDHLVRLFGSQNIEEGIVSRGMIMDTDALVTTLLGIKKYMGGITSVHAALPEEAVYVFSMQVPQTSSREQIMSLIEFEFEGRIPIPVSVAVYDYDIIENNNAEGTQEIGVTVFPRDITERYAEVFTLAGLTLASLEVEASSIGRAVRGRGSQDPMTLLVDFGRARTGFAIIKRGIPIFTSTVEIGGDTITHAVETGLGLTGDAVGVFKDDQGLLAPPETLQKLEGMTGHASALADEVARHYNYWDMRRGEHGEHVTPIGRIVLVGGSANLRGLPELVASRVQAPVSLGDLWSQVCSFDDYIPPIDFKTSLEYATALGLALRGI